MDAEYWEQQKPKFITQPETQEYDNHDTYPAVPQELKKTRQWLVWRQEFRDGKPTKIPYQINAQKAKSNDPATWTDYHAVCKALSSKRWDGIGFVFTADDPLCGIDLDDCLADRILKPWAVPIVDRLKLVSYGEVSPSGNGIKFWTHANLPVDSKHKVYLTSQGKNTKQGEDDAGAIEAYDNTRYFTITGKGKGDILDGQQAVDWIYQTYLKPQPKPANTHKQQIQHSHAVNLSVDEIINKIHQSRQADKFDQLMHGNTTGYGSTSEADLALCAIIAFWTQETNTIDAIFRQSKLMRDKWDEKHRADGATYGQMTIEKALSEIQNTYTQNIQKHRRFSNERQRNRDRKYRNRKRRR